MDLPEWQGDCPFYLLWVPGGGGMPLGPIAESTEIVDLDRPGWLADQGYIFRATPSEMYLIRKAGNLVVLSVCLLVDEQGYYTARHIGIAGSGGTAETIAYGIGKKRADGNEDNLWVLPWGQVCVGKDVEHFALQGLKKGLA